MRQLAGIAVTFFAVFVAGCATTSGSMSSEECQNADWRAIGREDGLKGAPMEMLGYRAEQCGKSDASIDVVGYRAGRQEGLVEFCTKENGFEFGYGGGDYHGTCPEESAAAFMSGYRDGITIYKLKQDVKEKERALRKMERDMDRKQVDLKSYERRYASAPASERARMQVELRTLAHDIRQLQDLRARLQYELAQSEKALATYKKRHGLE